MKWKKIVYVLPVSGLLSLVLVSRCTQSNEKGEMTKAPENLPVSTSSAGPGIHRDLSFERHPVSRHTSPRKVKAAESRIQKSSDIELVALSREEEPSESIAAPEQDAVPVTGPAVPTPSEERKVIPRLVLNPWEKHQLPPTSQTCSPNDVECSSRGRRDVLVVGTAVPLAMHFGWNGKPSWGDSRPGSALINIK